MDIWQTCVGFDFGLNRSECASWVQAWGSIAAILVAVGIGWWQHRSAVRAERRRDVAHRQARLVAVAAVLPRVKAMCITAIAAFDHSAATWKSVQDSATNIHRMVVGVSSSDVPDVRLAHYLGLLSAGLTQIITFAELATQAERPITRADGADMEMFIDKISTRVDIATARCRKLLKASLARADWNDFEQATRDSGD